MNFTIWKYENGYQTDVIPIVYLHSFRGNGEDVWKACHRLKDCPPMRRGCGRVRRLTRGWRRGTCTG